MKIACIILLSFTFFTSAVAQTGWNKIPCPDGMRDYSSKFQFFSEDNGLFFSYSVKKGVFKPLISKTVDGGRHWQNILLPDSISLTDHCFPNEHTIYIEGKVNDSLEMFFSKDAGMTWSYLPLIPRCYGGIWFTSESVGYSCGQGKTFNKYTQRIEDGGVIYKTIDNGRTWKEIWSDSSQLQGQFSEIYFDDELHGSATLSYVGMCMGFSEVWVTEDGGRTWSHDSKLPAGVLLHHVVNTDTWIKIQKMEGKVYRSTDNGKNWTPLFLKDKIVSISFSSNQIGYLLSSSGSIYKTSDAGNSWYKQTIKLDSATYAFEIITPSDQTAYIVGTNFIFKTVDGGGSGTLVSDVKERKKSVLNFSLDANPVSEYADFRFESGKNSGSLQVFDVTGRLMRTLFIPSETTSYHLKIDDLPQGIYIVRLGTEIIQLVKL
jgi:photosystem II stability/assembly factor-like uncharacterized protein